MNINITPKIIVSVISLLVVVLSYSYHQADEDTAAEDLRLVHNVYFYLNDNVSEEEVAEFEVGLEELLSISEIHHAEMGVPAKTEERDVTDHGFVYSIFTEFTEMDDYEVYAEHPVHMKFIEKYNHLWAEVKVYDSEIIYDRQ